ncbi:MAG: hypothetical protein EXR58_02215 [Chloroflexi bacterium]|nr:hypothetical protein [Chloroflexota bacterium]
MTGRIVGKLAFLVGMVVLLGGAGGVAYEAGLAQGLGQAGAAVAPGAGYWPYFHPFGFLGFLAPLFFLFLMFGLIRTALWGHRWGGRHGGWASHSTLEDWHRRMHEDRPEGGSEPIARV